MENEMISVIIPIYNTPKDLLLECIESVAKQTYQNLEILLIDDGSTSDLARCLDTLKEINARIKVIHKPNGGLSSSRNTGIELAKGDYITFVDSDDVIEENMLSSLFEVLHSQDVDIAGGLFYTFSDNTRQYPYMGPKLQVYSGDDTWRLRAMMLNPSAIDGIYYPFSMCAWGKLYKRSLFENEEVRFPVDMYTAEDQIFFQELLSKDCSIAIVSEALYGYRQVTGSLTHRFREHFLAERLSIIAKLDTIMKKEDKLYDAYAMYRFGTLIDIGKQYIGHRDNHKKLCTKINDLKIVSQKLNISECQTTISKKYFSYAQNLYLWCLKYRLYLMAYIMAKIAAARVS